MYDVIADGVMLAHAALIIAVLFGIAISVKYKRYRPVEAGILLMAVVIWSLYEGCPLTFVEDYYRNQTPTPIHLAETGFIPYYLNDWVGINLSNRGVEILTYSTAVVFLLLTVDWEFPILKKAFLKKKNSKSRK